MIKAGGALALLIAAAVVLGFWYFRAPSGPHGPSAAEVNACQAKVEKIADVKFRKTAHLSYFAEGDADNRVIGWLLLTKDTYNPRNETVTLNGSQYTRNMNMSSGDYLKVVKIDKSRDHAFQSSKQLLSKLCQVDPLNQFVRGKDAKQIRAELIDMFVKK